MKTDTTPSPGTASTPPHHRPSHIALGIAVAIAAGCLGPVQSRLNSELASRSGDGYFAGMAALGAGLVVLTVIVATTDRGRHGFTELRRVITSRAVPWWYFAGGFFGAIIVLAQSLSVAVLGVALVTVSLIAGTTIAGAVIDHRGLGSIPSRSLGGARVLGAGLMLLAVVIAIGGDISTSGSWVWVAMPLVAGLGAGVQQAVNAQVGELTGSILIATWTNFAVGFVVLVVAFVVHGVAVGLPAALPSPPAEVWLYAGGVLRCCFTAAGVLIVRKFGVLFFGLGTVTGQLLGSIVADLLVPPAGYVLPWNAVAGVAMAFIAVVIASSTRRSVS